jgi:hypothetical protein
LKHGLAGITRSSVAERSTIANTVDVDSTVLGARPFAVSEATQATTTSA